MRAHRPHGVVLMAVAALLIVLAGAVALFAYAGAAMNQSNQARDAEMVQRGINRRLNGLRAEVASTAIRNDAYQHTVVALDPAWVRMNFDCNYQRYLGHDLTVVVDPQGRIIYAGRQGTAASAAALRPFIDAVQPLAARVRSAERARIAANSRAMGPDRAGAVRGAVRAGRQVYLVAASSVEPEPGYAGPLRAGPSAVVISAVTVDQAYLRGVGEAYGIDTPRLLDAPPAGQPSVAVRDIDGKILSAITWRAGLPAHGVLLRARWPILGVAALLAALVVALILRVRRLANDLMTARDAASAADRAKSVFIANTSHEVRTPLNGILGMAQVMALDELQPLQRQRLDVIREAGASLLAILNDVLDMSKIQAGKIELETVAFDVEELARNACAAFKGLALAKDIRLEVTVSPRAAGRWVGDALRLRQVISNLVSNAVKFTEAGAVTIQVEAEDAGLVLSVADTGIGLAPEELPRLFGKFSQAEVSTTRRYGGTGLGLSISLHLVELMGGRIEVESQKGKGSRFSVFLPLARDTTSRAAQASTARQRPEDVPAPATPHSLRILAAEDNATNQLVLKSLLAPLDVSLTMTSHGGEAVDAFKAGCFDLVLMDVQMPHMNGIAATQAIRAFEQAEHRPRVPILALSANVMAHQVAEYLAIGMDGHIAKPIDIAELYAAIETVMGADQATGEADAA